jgi:hypothetical protein
MLGRAVNAPAVAVRLALPGLCRVVRRAQHISGSVYCTRAANWPQKKSRAL